MPQPYYQTRQKPAGWFSADVQDTQPVQDVQQQRASLIDGSRGIQGAVPEGGLNSLAQMRQMQAVANPGMQQESRGARIQAQSPGGNGIGGGPDQRNPFANSPGGNPLAALLTGNVNANPISQDAYKRKLAWLQARGQGLIPEGPGGMPEQGSSYNQFMRG